MCHPFIAWNFLGPLVFEDEVVGAVGVDLFMGMDVDMDMDVVEWPTSYYLLSWFSSTLVVGIIYLMILDDR